MPRIYKTKNERNFDAYSMRQAIVDVIDHQMSIRQSAEKNNITKSRLYNYVSKARDNGLENLQLTPNFRKSQVFPPEMELTLEAYLLKCSAMFYGLTPKLLRRLAYEYANSNNIEVSPVWVQKKMASTDWFWGFMHRHPKLSVRKPEATSLARMTSFNRSTVKVFQDKLEQVITRYSFTPEKIFNLDETGVTTVQKVQKIVGKKGAHQIGQVTSRERGELVTQVGIICASGSALPPVWIFPRCRFDQARMMKGISDTGPLGLVHPSGWMTSENFLKVLEHFVKHTKCNKESKVLLVMDNHESHLSIDAVNFCRANGIVILTLPPHTSNKLQPLDRTVFGPFKTFFNQAADAWMLTHPGQTLSIYDLPLLCLQSWDRAANPVNIKSGFRCSGIVPFDRNIFSDDEYLSSAVTDREQGNESTNQKSNTFDLNETINEGSPKKSFVTPEAIRPFPKAPPRKETNNRGRKKGRCMIATDTPEKQLLEEKKKIAQNKTLAKKKEVVKRQCFRDESSDEEIEEMICDDKSSDGSSVCDSDEEQSITDVPKGGFIIVNVYGKNSLRKYVAIVEEKFINGYDVRFLKRQIPSNRFSFTDEESASVYYKDVVKVLPNPIKDSRKRFHGMIYFNEDLSEYSLQ